MTIFKDLWFYNYMRGLALDICSNPPEVCIGYSINDDPHKIFYKKPWPKFYVTYHQCQLPSLGYDNFYKSFEIETKVLVLSGKDFIKSITEGLIDVINFKHFDYEALKNKYIKNINDMNLSNADKDKLIILSIPYFNKVAVLFNSHIDKIKTLIENYAVIEAKK